MRENNNSKWGEGLVQSQKNNRLHSGISRTPFKTMFGENRYSDLSGNGLPNDVWQQLEGEEDLAEALGVVEEEEEGAVDDSDHESYETDLIGGISDEPRDIIIRNMHFCPGTITTHAESINSDLQRGLERRLRHTQH